MEIVLCSEDAKKDLICKKKKQTPHQFTSFSIRSRDIMPLISPFPYPLHMNAGHFVSMAWTGMDWSVLIFEILSYPDTPSQF